MSKTTSVIHENDKPVKTFDCSHMHAKQFQLGDRLVTKIQTDPGFRWTEHVKPVLNTRLCEKHHMMYVTKGSITIKLENGEEKTASRGDLIYVPPNHDSWVNGDEPAEAVDFY